MQKPALLASLLTVLCACASDRLIATAYDPTADGDGGSDAAQSDERALVAAASALEGSWRPDAFFDTQLTVTFHHEAGTPGGTYEVTCPIERCFPADAGLFSPIALLAQSLVEGEFKLFEIDDENRARGLITGAQNFGFFLLVSLPLGKTGVDVSNIPFVRVPRPAP